MKGHLLSRSPDFYPTTRLFFYYITLLGLRPFKLPGERYKVGQLSISGTLLAMPPILLAAYHTQFMLRNSIFSAQMLGFFSGQTMVMLGLFLCFCFLFLYLSLSVLFAPNLSNTVSNLCSFNISPASHIRFITCSAIASVSFIILHVILSYFLITSYNEILQQSRVPVGFKDYVTFFSLVYVVGVLLFPIIFLGLLAFYLGKVYDEQCECLRDMSPRKIEQQLPSFYQSYMSISKVVEEADGFFSYITLGIVCISLINIANYILNISNLSTIPVGLYATLQSLMLLNFLSYIFLCTWLNDKSRAIQKDLHEVLPHSSEIHMWIETFNRKINDESWGLTLGKFCLLQRTTFLELINAMITYLALYGQFAPSDSSATNSTLLDEPSDHSLPPPGH